MESKIRLWIARDESGILHVFENKPYRDNVGGYFKGIVKFRMREVSFPSVRWENSPRQVELKLIEE